MKNRASSGWLQGSLVHWWVLTALAAQCLGAVAVTVSPAKQGVEVGKTVQFKAAVTGASDQTVTWSATDNGIDASSGLYKAPATVPTTNPVTVTATSKADNTQSSTATVTIQAAGARPASLPIKVNPAVIQPVGGKLPASALVSISISGCNDSSLYDLSTGGYSLVMTGVGLTFGAPSPSKCFMTSTLTIDPTTSPGTFSAILKDGDSPIGSAEFGILDAAAGPIPPGLAPQVDATFGVLGQNICQDTFGKRVAQHLYCVTVRIGNNSGHSIQIAGIGFKTQLKHFPDQPTVTVSNNTYASTRAVLQRESVLSGRNILYNSLEASGLIMSSFTPFFVRPNAKAHFATGAAILSGAILQGFNIIAPDRVVGQLNNLDDQSFRDNQVIPNNTQVVTIVFVEKTAVSELLEDLRVQFNATSGKAAAQADSEEAKKQAVASYISDRAEETVKNSRVPTLGKGSFSPLLVQMALGNIVIVGDPLIYLPRVQIIGGSTPPAASGVLVSISPTAQTLAVNGTQTFAAAVTGNTNTSVTWSVNDNSGGNTTVGTIDTSGKYTAPASVPTPNQVTVKATSAADTKQFASATVTITPPSPATVTVSPNPASVAVNGTQTFTATVSGSPGATVTWSVTGGGTIDTSGKYTAPAAVPSPNQVTVTATTAAGQTGAAVVTIH